MKYLDKIIAERRSVRSFNTNEPMTEKEAEILRVAYADAISPFGGKVSVALKRFDLKGAFKPGFSTAPLTAPQSYVYFVTPTTHSCIPYCH